MKTLEYRLRKHNAPLESKLKIYSMFYSRQLDSLPRGVEKPHRYYVAKDKALKLTYRFLAIYGKYIK